MTSINLSFMCNETNPKLKFNDCNLVKSIMTKKRRCSNQRCNKLTQSIPPISCDNIHKHILELNESRASYYSQYTLNLDVDINELTARGKRIQSGRTPRSAIRRLPPLDSSQDLKQLTDSQSSIKQTYEIIQATAAPLLPVTSNKKRLPEKLQSISCSSVSKLKKNCNENFCPETSYVDCETPVTIDILSESGRTSKQSILDLITPREPTHFKYPHVGFNSHNKDNTSRSRTHSISNTPANLLEDPILMFTNQVYDTNLDNRRNSATIKTNKSTGFDTSNIYCRQKEPIHAKLSVTMTSNTCSSSNGKLRLSHSGVFSSTDTTQDERKSFNKDVYDYTDEFDSEEEEEEEDDEEEFDDSESSDEDKNEYSHLKTLKPILKKPNTNLNNNSSSHLNLDTINESIRESVYESSNNLPNNKNNEAKNDNKINTDNKLNQNTVTNLNSQNKTTTEKNSCIQTQQPVQSKANSNCSSTAQNANKKPAVGACTNAKPNIAKNANSCTNVNKTCSTKSVTRCVSLDKNCDNKQTCNQKSISNQQTTKPKIPVCNNKPKQTTAAANNNNNRKATLNIKVGAVAGTKLANNSNNTKKEISVEKIDVSKKTPDHSIVEYERVSDYVPNFIESSRMEKSIPKPVTGLQQSTAESELTTVTLEFSADTSKSTVQSKNLNPPANSQLPHSAKTAESKSSELRSRPITKPVNSAKSDKSENQTKLTKAQSSGNLLIKQPTNPKLEINSNKINLTAKPSSAKTKKAQNEQTEPEISIEQPKPTSSPSSFELIKQKTNDNIKLTAEKLLIEPQEPLIYDMYGNVPHPFAVSMPVKPKTSATNRASSGTRINSSNKNKKTTKTKKTKSTKTNKTKSKPKKLLVSKTEINMGCTTNFSLADGKPENLPFENYPSRLDNYKDTDMYEYSDNEDNLCINDVDDSSTDSETTELAASQVPVINVSGVHDVESSNEQEIEVCDSDMVLEIDNPEYEISFQNSLNKSTSQSLGDKMKSVTNRVDEIYEKVNTVINATKMDDDKPVFKNQPSSNKNEIKIISEDELKQFGKDIDFNKISNDPELVRTLNEVFRGNENERNTTDKAVPTANEDKSKDSMNNSISMRSIKSNANIREVYTMVNSLRIKNTDNNLAERDEEKHSNTLPEKTGLPPRPNKEKSKAAYEPNLALPNKIYTLIGTMASTYTDISRHTNTKIIPNNPSKYDSIKSKQSEVKKHEENENASRLHQYLSLDSVGSETIKSNNSNSDENSGTERSSHNYEKLYHNNSASNTDRSILDIKNYNEFPYKWRRGSLLGKGAFGMVYQALISTGSIIAVKQVEMEESDPVKARKEYENVREEVQILKELDHLNIVKFLGTSLEGNIVNIYMEFIPGGTIESLLKMYGKFDEELFKNFTNQICQGVDYIHSNNVVHRDIKGRNIMLMQSGIIKLIDFGCAKRLKKSQSSNSVKHLLKSLKGTPYWMAPEVIRETGHGSKADIWSIGCTVFEMATGQPPWFEIIVR